MKSWRPKKRRNYSSKQPAIPGLFSSDGAPPTGLRKTPRKTTSPGEHALERARPRLGILLICFALIFMVISGRVTFLTLKQETQEGTQLHALSAASQITARADITDRNGTVLATSLPTMMLMANAKNILDPIEAAGKLREILPHLNAQKLAKALESTKHYLVIQRHLTPKQYYAINTMGIAGLEFVPDESRIYPSGNITSHLLGYTDVDNNGIAGIEKAKDEYLKTAGKPLISSIDLRLQTILHRELSDAIKTFKAIGAAGVIMDAQTGEVLSMVSLPDFNPQDAGSAPSDSKFNRATLGVYEMGSTFKSFNTAMALDRCGIKAAQKFDTTQSISIGGRTIRDFHRTDHWMNVAEIYMESSNIGSARMAEICGRETQRSFLSSLGLMDKMQIELPEVGAPIIPPLKRWGDTTVMTVAYGHGIAVNAVQMTAATAALVNGGYRVQPTLLKKSESSEKEQGPTDRIISEKTSEQMRALMRIVVKYGTAKKADVPGYLVGGKTGTADKLNGNHYNENARISSFLGVFPINAPRYVVLALLDDPKGNASTYGFATGGWTAAPVVKKVISQIGPLLNLSPFEPEVIEATEHRLLRPLGASTLSSLNINNETDDYAAVESNSAR
ncbi:MAG: penicillin-binding protein 2 [Proteobacteria bacterium]|nr:penicillin-binding protein 2 [Pseudomonadota bacterium]